MAACELTIALDEPKVSRIGGETVSGNVKVTTTGPVKCGGLEIASCWSTHGRGNVEMGEVDQCAVFEGEWEANREYCYPFTLKTAAWPPTYYGTYLNVSHYVRARAKVPWSSDPKAETEFTILATIAPEDLKPVVAAKPKSTVNLLIGWTVGLVLLVIFGAMFSFLLLFLVPIAVVGGGGYWFFRVFLPRQLTGPVECIVEPTRLSPGETVQGRLRFTPRRNVTIGGIQWCVTCVEKCVSGSGTNKTTHRYEVLNKTDRLAEARLLRLGEPQAFEFTFPVPEQAPLSLKFSDNELIWSGELRIDIPKWPDWVKTFPLTVVPSAKSAAGPVPGSAVGPGDSIPLGRSEEEIWFDEVVQQVLQSHGDRDRMRTVLEAVRDHAFTVRADIVGPQKAPPTSAWRESGTWMLADYRPQDVELCLLWAGSDKPPSPRTANWRGQATILGYDDDLDCLLMRVFAR